MSLDRGVTLNNGYVPDRDEDKHSPMAAHATEAPRPRAAVLEPPDLSMTADLPKLDNGPREPWKVPAWAKSVADRDGVVGFDTETTGLHGAAIEVGVVDAEGRAVYHAYVIPLEPIHPKAAAVHGLTEEHLAELGARPWVEVSDELREALRGRTVVAYNDEFFDKTVLERTDTMAGTPSSAPDVAWVDVMQPYQSIQGHHKTMKLTEASADFGVPLSQQDAHGAMADARATMGLIQAMSRQEGASLGPQEVFLHLNRHKDAEAFDAKGKPMAVDTATMNEAMGKGLAMDWAKPRRAIDTLNRGGFIKIELPAGVELKPEVEEPGVTYHIENDRLSDDWTAFGSYREAEDFVWEQAAEIAKANVDENGMGNVPAFSGLTERDITERIFLAEVGTIEKLDGGHPEPPFWVNPAAKELDHLLKQSPRGARAEAMSHEAVLAGGSAVVSGDKRDHDDAKALHALAAEAHRAFARNINPEVGDHSNKIADLHDQAARWHAARGSVFAKPSDFASEATTDFFYLRKYGKTHPPEREETDRAIAGKPITEGRAN